MNSLNSLKNASILVIEPHALIRVGLAQLINQQPDLICCAQLEEHSGVGPLVAKKKPDLLLLGLSPCDGNGVELIISLHQRFPNLPLVVFSENEDVMDAEHALRVGASGYLLKTESAEEIINGIRTVLNGEAYVSSKLARSILKKLVGARSQTPGEAVANLTDRELEVFRMLGTGMSTKAVASKLHLSFKTVETYRERLKRKLGLPDANALLHSAMVWVQEGFHVPQVGHRQESSGFSPPLRAGSKAPKGRSY